MKFKNIYNEKFEPMESVYIPIQPKKEEAERIKSILETLRNLYNRLLRKVREDWEEKKTTADYFELVRCLNEWRKERKDLAGIHTRLIENVAMRICLTFDKWSWEKSIRLVLVL